MAQGVAGLLRDKTRPARVPRLADEVAERIVALTLGEPPGETTHWTGRVMAKAAGVSVTSVQRIWRAHGLAPHRIRTFKLSNDPKFAAKALAWRQSSTRLRHWRSKLRGHSRVKRPRSPVDNPLN